MELLKHGRTNILPPILQQDADFWQAAILHHALSEYHSKSHNFINVVCVMSSLYHSIVMKVRMIRSLLFKTELE